MLYSTCDNNRKEVKSLQNICRGSIITTLTLKNIQQVANLPLPPIIKEFLCTFNIPADFNTDGIYEDYNFNFPNHVHHKTHQIHPARCVLNGSNVLLKYQSSEECSMCKGAGFITTASEKTREKWAYLRHENLMACQLRMFDSETKVSLHVLDFPVINLEDLVIRAFVEGNPIPEHLIWDILKKLTSVLQYLASNDIYPWELCHPRHVVVNESGNIMLENMLLYLPSRSGSPFQIETCARLSNYASPEQLKGRALSSKTLIWGVGCILSELASLIPSSLQKTEDFQIILPPCAKPRSYTLRKTIERCLQEDPRKRPTLKELGQKAVAELSKMDKRNNGATNLLRLYSSYWCHVLKKDCSPNYRQKQRTILVMQYIYIVF